MKNIKQKTNFGYSLVELIFYIALFSIIFIAVINALMVMTKGYKETAIQADLIQSSSIMERISREVRQSNNIFSISTGDLKLNTKDELGNNKTIRFVRSGTNIVLYEDDVLVGNLNTPNIRVTDLSFTQINTTMGQAIKISISVESVRDLTARNESFYSTVVLRGGY